MKTFEVKRQQFLPIPLSEAWDFFSNPENLSRITPPEMSFKILSGPPPKMYAGMIIRYDVKPMAGISSLWVSEITHVRAPHFFVDEQRLGPYKLWHHQHRFQEVNGGTLIEDEVNLALPFGVMGIFAYHLFIKKKLQKIFDYRESVLEKMFQEKDVKDVA